MMFDSQFDPMQQFHNKNFTRIDPQYWMRNHHAMRPHGEEYLPWEGTDSEESISPPDTFVTRGGQYSRPYSTTARLSPIDESDYGFPPIHGANGSEMRGHPYYGHHSPSAIQALAPMLNKPEVASVSPPVVPKCRQLPCRTFISAGSCPYGDRCVFLHDMSIVSKPVYIKSKVSKVFIQVVSLNYSI